MRHRLPLSRGVAAGARRPRFISISVQFIHQNVKYIMRPDEGGRELLRPWNKHKKKITKDQVRARLSALKETSAVMASTC
jgi:hypothetical protein